jgi:DNA-binding beta-propeller fold protein YncE
MHGCKHPEKPVAPTYWGGFPEEIGMLIQTKCATTGCHNEKSKDAAAGISLVSWEQLMRGGRNNATVVAYSPLQSSLFLFCNTYEDLGPGVAPTMPYGQAPLSRKEVESIKQWITQGAPSSSGVVPFEDKAERKKAYVLNGFCNTVSVIDIETNLIMRYVRLPEPSTPDFPELIKVNPNGNYWYVLYASGKLVRFTTLNDQLSGSLTLKTGLWRSMVIDQQGKRAFLSNFAGNSHFTGGAIAIIDLESFRPLSEINAAKDSLYFPHGLSLHESNEKLYAVCYTGNFVYEIDIHELPHYTLNKIPLSTESINFNGSPLRPRNTLAIGDSLLAVACEKSGEIRFVNINTSTLEKVVEVGASPQEMVLANNLPYLLVSCTEDQTAFNNGKGAVHLINTQNLTVDRVFYTGYQPKGMALNKKREQVYVANRNADPVGADAPHHYTDCDGNNGYVTIIDLYGLRMLKDYKAEVAVDPYSVGITP